jgi:hypothetical protein
MIVCVPAQQYTDASLAARSLALVGHNPSVMLFGAICSYCVISCWLPCDYQVHIAIRFGFGAPATDAATDAHCRA